MTPTTQDGKEKKEPIELFYQEGLIRLSPDGQTYTNQTGGVCCNHPEATGFFQPMQIPKEIKNITWDTCCPNEEEIAKCNQVLQDLSYPFRITGGEEAWLIVRGLDFEGILTYENSD